MMPSDLENLSTVDADNAVLADGGWPENMDRSPVNDQARKNMGALRRFFEDGEWVDLLQESGGLFTVSRVNATTIRITDSTGTDATSKFQISGMTPLTGMYVRVTGTDSGTVNVAYGSVKTIGPYGAPNLDIILENLIDETWAIEDRIPDTTVTKVECYFNRRIKAAAFHPTGATLAQTPAEIPTADDLGSAAFVDDGDIDAATLEGSDLAAVTALATAKDRNVLTNGAMQVWQRGVTINDSSVHPNDDVEYCADNVLLLSDTDDHFDITKETSDLPDGFHSALRMTAVNTTGGGNSEQGGIVVIAEGADCKGIIDEGTCSLSFYYKLPTTTGIANLRATVFSWGSTEDVFGASLDLVGTWNGAGSDPSPSSNWTVEQTGTEFVANDDWVRAEIAEITLTASQKNLAAFIWIDDVSYSVGDHVIITGIQLEKGASVTAFDHRRIGEEFSRCERYFVKTYNQLVSPGAVAEEPGKLQHSSAWASNLGSDAIISWPFPTRMRITPHTNAVYSPVTGDPLFVDEDGSDVAAVILDPGESGLTIHITASLGNTTAVSAHATADASFA